MRYIKPIPASIFLLVLLSSVSILAQDIEPGDLEFRRQAVRRMIFDRSQDIPLSGLWPATAIGLDVMHPQLGEQLNKPQLAIEEGRLKISAQTAATSTRWIGGFSPFAVYDVALNSFNGSGEIGMIFRDSDAENWIMATLVVDDGMYQSIHCVVVKDGQEVETHNVFMIPRQGNGVCCFVKIMVDIKR